VVTIAAEALSVTLGARAVVDGVSVRIGTGLTGILGPNGAGKSTLVRALLGLIPFAGNVSIDGESTASLGRAKVARTIAYLPQGQTVHWPVSAERLVMLGRVPYLGPLSRPGEADRDAVRRAMALAEVGHLGDRAVTELSGGERARVLLARALAVEAPALIADEPLASLDPAHQIGGMEILRARADAGGTVVAVLHDLTLAARFCERLLVMDGGRLVADGAPDAVLTPALLAEVYGVSGWFGEGLVVPLERLTLTNPPARG